jgi:hypothetical protein
MPWYAWLYIAYLVWLTATSVRAAMREDDSLLYTVCDLVAAACEIGFVVAWFRDVRFPHHAYAVAGALVFVLGWFIAACVRVARRRGWAEGLSDASAAKALRYGILLSTVRVLPTLVAGFGVLVRSMA